MLAVPHPSPASVRRRSHLPPREGRPRGGDGELCQGTDQHPEKQYSFACSTGRDGRLTSRTRLFFVASVPPSLQRPPHRGAGAEPCRALSPVSLAQEKPGRRRRRRRKSHGLRIRGFRKRPRMLACVRLLLLSKPKQRLRFGKRERGGTENIADLQITYLKSKRVLPGGSSAAQRRVSHPLVYRRTYAPFASAPWAPGVQGNAPAALFPRFLSRKRNRAAGGIPPSGVNAVRVTRVFPGRTPY